MNDLLTRSQLGTLQRIADAGTLPVAAKNDDRHIASASARALVARGLVDLVEGGARLTEAGRACVAANAGHAPQRIQDTPAYRRGWNAAVSLRRRSIDDLRGRVAFLEGASEHADVVALNFSKFGLARYESIEATEATNDGR